MGLLDLWEKLVRPKRKRKPRKRAKKIKAKVSKGRIKPTIKKRNSKKAKRKKPAKVKKKPQAKKKSKAQKKRQNKSAKKKPAKTIEKLKQKAKEKEIGVVVHYFNKISVGVIKLKESLRIGDKIHIKGTHDDFIQTITSMQVNHESILYAKKGSEVGLKTAKPVYENDKVYKKVKKK